ncbi:unnamed protein product [Arctia plantaginis]|uniref:Uncharacterized protein n=1 Tax=Arctia plantaginis TaxID=874455 RepID=A0A8S0Z451_ARCPL|nr:unnamed protein product [Arctia plantaginis]
MTSLIPITAKSVDRRGIKYKRIIDSENMKWLIILAAISALVGARPEKYKEQEDFQYSRSSSDDGTKSGYYDAQRGNMGGNYERAHNMDSLAQHQMSGLVRQVEGELGDGAKMRTGSVYSAASSRGMYGSGHFDTSNLQGRNFQEGVSYDNSNLGSSHTAHSSSAHNSANYASRHSQSYGGYGRTTSDTQSQAEDLVSVDDLQTSKQQNYGSTRHSSGYQSQAGLQEQRHYDSDSTNSHTGYGSNIYTRYTPVRIVVTPGGRIALPVTVQTYDATHGSSILNHNALDSEVAASDMNQGSVYRPGNTKYYEASYKYNKKWEKHDTVPTSVSVVAPTETPVSKHSELYEDVDIHPSGNQNNARETDFRSAHLSSASGRYNAAKTTSRQSGYNTNYNSQRYNGGSSNSNAYTHAGHRAQVGHSSSSDSLNAQPNIGSIYSGISTDSALNKQARYNAGSQLDMNSQVEDLSARPKSYHSSYSYHKSWEHQGDPYVIEPVSTTNSNSHTSQRLTSSTKNLGFTTYQPSSQYSQRNCEDNCHMRVTRSQGTDNQHMEQQSQSLYDDQDLGQQVQGTWKNFEDLGQLSQKDWGQQTDGQQSLSQWDNLKDLSQQSQGNRDLQNVEQQSQNNWEQQNVGQQSQNNWGQQNVGQQSENHWENLGQQTQSNWDQQNVEQQKTQDQANNLENLNQSQSNWEQLTAGQQTDSHTSAFENLGQISQNNWDQQNLGQQTNINWDKIETLDQQSNSNWDQQNVVQQPNDSWDKLEKLNQQSLTKSEEVGQHLLNQHTWNKFEDIRSANQKNDNSDIFGQHARNVLEQQNQDLEYELSYKPQHDLYAQFAHTSEVIPKDTNLQYSESEKEKELGKKINIIWDKFNSMDVDNVKVNFSHIQNNTKNNTEIQIHENDDDFLSQNESHFYKDIINDNIDIALHQKESNDNSDYSYSNGFVNPFFNQYHKNQLSHYDSTFSENNGAFETNNWNSHLHSYSNSDYDLQNVNNSHINIQDTSLTSLWSKFEKIDSGLSSEMNHTNTFLTKIEKESNLTSIDANGNSTIVNQPWYVRDPQETESSTASERLENKGSLSDKIDPKDLQPLYDDKPETPQDIGRGDIEPEEIIDIDESKKRYKNKSSVVSQNTFVSPVEHDNDEKKVDQNNNIYRENELLDDKLAVLSIQQQKNENIHVHLNKSELTNNMLQTISQQNKNVNQKEYNTDLQNVKINETVHQNVINHEVELQNSPNFEQESVNVEQENLYNFGQEDLQVFAQQNENVENQYLHNFQETLPDFKQGNENSEQQNSYNFGQEQLLEATRKNIEHQSFHNFGQEQTTKKYIEQHNSHNFGREQGLEATGKNIEQQNSYNFDQNLTILYNATQKNKNTEQETVGSENKLIFEKEQRNHSQQDFDLHKENNHNNTQKQIENREQQNLRSKDTIGFNNAQTQHVQLDNHHYEQITPTNLPRVQKSVGSIEVESSLNKNQEDLLYVQQNIQDLGGQSEHMPLEQIVEHNYAVDYEPNIASFEQEFEQDLGQQHQTSNGFFNKFEQQSQNLAVIQQNTQQSIIKSNPTTTSTQRTIISAQKTEKVTEKPSFWRSVGNKISSAKDKVVTWFRSKN